MKSYDITHQSHEFLVDFDESGHVEKIQLYVGYIPGFVVDYVVVTDQAAKYLVEYFENYYAEQIKVPDEDKAYESWKARKLEAI